MLRSVIAFGSDEWCPDAEVPGCQKELQGVRWTHLRRLWHSSFAFSMADTANFPVGFESTRKIMTSEESGLEAYEAVRHLIASIASQHHGIGYAEAYAVKFLDAVETTEVERAVQSAELATFYPTGSSLHNSFRTVASVISLPNTRGSGRDTFYVSYGG